MRSRKQAKPLFLSPTPLACDLFTSAFSCQQSNQHNQPSAVICNFEIKCKSHTRVIGGARSLSILLILLKAYNRYAGDFTSGIMIYERNDLSAQMLFLCLLMTQPERRPGARSPQNLSPRRRPGGFSPPARGHKLHGAPQKQNNVARVPTLRANAIANCSRAIILDILKFSRMLILKEYIGKEDRAGN